MPFAQTVLFKNKPGALIRVTGEDTFSFLQGQFTNELRQPPDSATYGLWLNQKGKILADSHVLRISEREFLIFSVVSPAAVIRQRLEEYIVADDVTLTDETAGAHGIMLGGAGSAAILGQVLGEAPAAGRFMRRGEIMAFGGRRVDEENFEIFGPESALAQLEQQLLARDVVAASAAEIEFARISAGIPSVPTDLGLGDLPNEGGMEDAALSYTKGCYLGQEVMARLKNLGQVRRRLHIVQGRGPAPAPLAPLYQGEKKVGEVRSVAIRDGEYVALAMLSLINFNPEADFSFTPNGPAVATVKRHG